jgi:hypothetical protein
MTKSIRRNKTFKTKKSRKNKKNLKLKGGASRGRATTDVFDLKTKIEAVFEHLLANHTINPQSESSFILNKEDVNGLLGYLFPNGTKGNTSQKKLYENLQKLTNIHDANLEYKYILKYPTQESEDVEVEYVAGFGDDEDEY